MNTLIKIFKSPWWDLAPVPAFILIAVLEGTGYWIGGVMTIVWLFSIALRHFVKDKV
jgi:hypothetical protein